MAYLILSVRFGVRLLSKCQIQLRRVARPANAGSNMYCREMMYGLCVLKFIHAGSPVRAPPPCIKEYSTCGYMGTTFLKAPKRFAAAIQDPRTTTRQEYLIASSHYTVPRPLPPKPFL